MRVGIATAKAMAHALRVPVIPIASLDLLALPLRYADRLIAAVIDARRGEVYYAFYRQVPGGVQRLEEPAVGPVDDLVAELLATGEDAPPGGRRRAAATGSRSAPASAASTSPSSGWPSPARRRSCSSPTPSALREEWVQPGEVQPLYLRRPDAEINWVDPGVGPEVGIVKILPERPSCPRDDLRRPRQPDAPPPCADHPEDRAAGVPAPVVGRGLRQRDRPDPRGPAATWWPTSAAAWSATEG